MRNNIQMPTIADFIEAIKSPQDNLHRLKRFRPLLNYDGTIDFWSNEECVVFHMIDSLQENYDFGLECCLTQEYLERQKHRIFSAPNNDIHIYEAELNVPQFLNRKFPVILHRKYTRKQNTYEYFSSKEESEFEISEDGKTLLSWKIPSGKIGVGLSDAVVPEGIEIIAEGAFAGCENLISVWLPKSLKWIGRGAFLGCGCFEIIFKSKHIDFIDEYAFWGCHLFLNKILGGKCLPESIGNFRDTAFKDTIIHYNGQEYSIWLAKRNGVWQVRVIEKNIIKQIEDSKSINKSSFPANDVYDDTFVDEDGVVYDKELRYVLDCKNSTLSKYRIIPSAIGILPNSFEGMKQLEEIDLSNVENIGDQAFACCDRLTNIKWGSHVRHIGKQAFFSSGFKNLFIPESVSHIGEGAFSRCTKLQSVEIRSTIDRIDEDMFRDCQSLTSVIIPDNVVSIERLAFGNCFSLQKINMPNCLIKIGELAFCNCSVGEIRLPKTLLDMDYSPFCGCRKTSIISESPLFYANEQFLLGYHRTRLISYLADETNIVIPGTVKVILGYSLSNKNRNAKIFLPNSVEYIGHWAFRSAKAKQINFPKSVSYVKSSFDYGTCIESYIIEENFVELLKGKSQSNRHLLKYNKNMII